MTNPGSVTSSLLNSIHFLFPVGMQIHLEKLDNGIGM